MDDHGGLQITDVAVHLTSDSGTRMVALARFTLNDAFVVRGIRIVCCASGRVLVVMPDHQRPDGVFVSTAFPNNDVDRRWIDDAILREYVAETQRAAARLAEADDEPFWAPRESNLKAAV